MTTERELTERLQQDPAVAVAVLFGSRAAGTARPDSDIDIGVLMTPGLSEIERWSVRLRLSAALEDLGAIDLVVLDDAPPLLAHRALSGRRLLVRDREAFVRFFVRTMARAEDERHWREIHRLARLRRLEEGRFGRP